MVEPKAVNDDQNTPQTSKVDAQFDKRTMQVAKFVQHISAKSKHPFSDGSLVSRLTAPAGPQASAAAPQAENPSVAETTDTLKDQLVRAIAQGKSKISFWENFLIRLKTLFSGKDACSIEIAKQAFSELDSGQLKTFLQSSFLAAASQENADTVASDVKFLLELCKEMGVETADIMKAVKYIDPNIKTKIFEILAQPDSGFDWNSLEQSAHGEVFKFLLNRGSSGNRTADIGCLKCLFENNKLNLEGISTSTILGYDDKVIDILSQYGNDGAYCIAKLLVNNILNPVNLQAFNKDMAYKVFICLADNESWASLLTDEVFNKIFGNLDLRSMPPQEFIGLADKPNGVRCLQLVTKAIAAEKAAEKTRRQPLEKAKEELKTAQREVETLTAKIDSLKFNLKTTERKRDTENEYLQKAKERNTLSLCNKDALADYEKNANAAQREVENLQQDIAKKSADLKPAQEKLATAQQEVDRLEAAEAAEAAKKTPRGLPTLSCADAVSLVKKIAEKPGIVSSDFLKALRSVGATNKLNELSTPETNQLVRDLVIIKPNGVIVARNLLFDSQLPNLRLNGNNQQGSQTEAIRLLNNHPPKVDELLNRLTN
ncbi:MAG: hypothetical protein LBE98_00650 [Puniceicoccales bacterium]|nr:hypothetical protein [Puniceicoccales bacterium]